MKNIFTCKSAAKSIHFYWVIFMLSIITSIFSSSVSAGKKDQIFPRQVNLSGNIFHFSMPEDFSKDMPAADMIESLDINDLKKFDDPQYGNLIRRWWDIKEPGWFGKKLGSVMMDISVQRVAENRAKIFHASPYDIKDRMDFILMLNDVYHQRYDEFNKTMQPDEGNSAAYNSGFAMVSGRKIFSLYHDHISNNEKWVRHYISAPEGATIVVLAIPVSEQTYLYVNFTYSPNSNIAPRKFNRMADAKFDTVYNSLNIEYTNSNEMKKVVSNDWLKHTNNEVLEQHRQSVQELFYGKDPEKLLLQQEKDLKEFKLKDKAKMREALKNDPL